LRKGGEGIDSEGFKEIADGFSVHFQFEEKPPYKFKYSKFGVV